MATAAELFDLYTKAKAAYDEEYEQNKKGHANAVSGTWVLPYNGLTVSQATFSKWLADSDASLLFKFNNLESAKKAYDLQKKAEDDKAEQDFKAKNPSVFENIQKAAISGSFMQGTTKYLIWGTIALVIVIGAIVVIKRRYSA